MTRRARRRRSSPRKRKPSELAKQNQQKSGLAGSLERIDAEQPDMLDSQRGIEESGAQKCVVVACKDHCDCVRLLPSIPDSPLSSWHVMQVCLVTGASSEPLPTASPLAGAIMRDDAVAALHVLLTCPELES